MKYNLPPWMIAELEKQRREKECPQEVGIPLYLPVPEPRPQPPKPEQEEVSYEF